ncbi:MAG TPA: AMP-binding protein, partial [Longimicrobiales bacterium]|nr:AMP-binding protein [Longimicrobiales bacterium]
MTLTQQLTLCAAEHGDRPAIIWHDRVWSWAELEADSARVAAGLTRQGIARGDVVGLLVPNIPPFLILFFALQRLGAVPLPINLLLRPGEIRDILEDSGARGLVLHEVFVPLVAGLRKEGSAPPALVVVGGPAPAWATGYEAVLEGTPPPTPPATGEEATAVLLYKAGPDGRTKGIMLSHRNLLHQGQMIRGGLSMTPADRTLLVLPLYHVFGIGVVLQSALATGSAVVLLEKFDPDDVLRALSDHAVTLFFGVPTMYAMLLRQASRADYALPEPLRLCICGAAPLPVEIAHRFEATFGAPIVEGYGLTEAAGATSVNPGGRIKLGTIGPAIAGNDMRILGPDGRERPPGEVGEIAVRGRNVMEGYFRRPAELTRRAVREGWLHTGDVGWMDPDGYFTIVARKHDLIIVGGENVYPREVEDRLREIPGVSDAAVRGVPHPI